MSLRIVACADDMYRSDVSYPASFHVLGVSHHTADVAVREQFAFRPAELKELLTREHEADRSALLLTTCNRCELYWTGEVDRETWFRQLAQARGVELNGALVRFDGADAVRHLFTVAAGLDSQILGESEILGQVRRAYDEARAAGTTTREMDVVFSAALATGRRIRHETLLGRHPSSVSSAAVELASRAWPDGLGDRPIVVLGAGEAAEGVLRALHRLRASRVSLVNRRPGRASVLATAWSATPHGWEALPVLLADAAVVFVATGASRPLVSARLLAEVVGGRSDELLTMDLSVPRNVEPEARAVEGVRLLDLDDLQRLCCPAAGAPAAALSEAERVLDDELERLELRLRGHAAGPRLAALHRLGSEVAEQETAWAFSRLAALSEADRQVVKEMADRLVRRVLYPVSRSLREE